MLAAVKSDNQELVTFSLDNIKRNLTEEEWKKWQKKYPINNILLSCKNKEMMKYLKDLKLNVKLDYDYSATYVIRHDNCVAALKFLIDSNMLNEKEQQEWLEQAILESREDVVRLLLKKQPRLALEKITRIYIRGIETFGYCSAEAISCSILRFAEQCCEGIKKKNKIIRLVENAQELVQGYHDNDLLDPEDHSPSTGETSIGSSFEVLNSRQPMEEDNELSDLESCEVIDDEDKLPILEFFGQSMEALENDLNDDIEGSPRSTVHSPSVTRSSQMHSQKR